MSRALGDIVASKVGVIPVPEIFEVQIKEKHRMLVLASDGIWEVLSNEEVIEIVGEYYKECNAEKACEELIERAKEVWNSMGENIDDITVIVVYLNS